MKSNLEKSKFFPALAWVTVIGFAYVTYTFTVELEAVSAQTVALSSYSI